MAWGSQLVVGTSIFGNLHMTDKYVKKQLEDFSVSAHTCSEDNKTTS